MCGRKIVCLCGSTKQHENYVEANRQETMKGNIVLSVGVFGHLAKEVHGRDIKLTEAEKDALDALHLDKVRMSDEVLIVGNVGDSTKLERELADKLGIPVRDFK